MSPAPRAFGPGRGDPDQVERPDQEPAAQRGIRQDPGQLALALLPSVPDQAGIPGEPPGRGGRDIRRHGRADAARHCTFPTSERFLHEG